ncbi:MAG: hypothetical protein ACTSWR_05360 [Candidatus Helarchaeota archaeon]
MAQENNEDIRDYEEDEDLEKIEILSESEKDIEADRSEIEKLGLEKESDRAFIRLFNKSDQKEAKKEEKKPPPEFFLVK